MFNRFLNNHFQLAKTLEELTLDHSRVILTGNSHSENYFNCAFLLLLIGKSVLLSNQKTSKNEFLSTEQEFGSSLTLDEKNISIKQCDKVKKLEIINSGQLVLRTSGTSGSPKLIVHNLNTLTESVKSFSQFYNFQAIDHWSITLPLHHVGGFLIPLRCLYNNAHYSFNDLSNIPKETTYLSLVPTQLQRIIEQNDESLKQLLTIKCIIIGGAKISSDLSEKSKRLNLMLSPSYGMTETAALIAAIRTKDFLAGQSTATFLPGIEAKVSTTLLLKSKALYIGVYKEGNFHPSDFLTNYFETNDLAEIEDNKLKVLGRADRVIISGGENINPSEMENYLLESNMFSDVAIVGIDDEQWGQRCHLFYVSKNTYSLESIKDLLKSFSSYKLPKTLCRLESLPYKGIKIDYKKLSKDNL